MYNTSTPFPIYPSQLKCFKEKAELLAKKIANKHPNINISAFKRNDLLSIALGYKGYADLVTSASFRVSSDKKDTLLLFSNKKVVLAITAVLVKRYPSLKSNDVIGACLMLSETFSGDNLMSYGTLNNLCSLIRGLMNDRTGSMWIARSNQLIEGILMITLDKRDNHDQPVGISDLRRLMPFSLIKQVAVDLIDAGHAKHPLVNYFSGFIGFSDMSNIKDIDYKRAQEQHNYCCMHIGESLNLLDAVV
jgi:hypothetical protein